MGFGEDGMNIWRGRDHNIQPPDTFSNLNVKAAKKEQEMLMKFLKLKVIWVEPPKKQGKMSQGALILEFLEKDQKNREKSHEKQKEARTSIGFTRERQLAIQQHVAESLHQTGEAFTSLLSDIYLRVSTVILFYLLNLGEMDMKSPKMTTVFSFQIKKRVIVG